MSTAPKIQTQPHASGTAPVPPREVVIYGHSTLFYWWPVWVVGYICAIITGFSHGRGAVVPTESVYVTNAVVTKSDRNPFDSDSHNVIVLPANRELPGGTTQLTEDNHFRERVNPDKNYGVVFILVLFVVIMITNVPLRGLSSAIVVSLFLLVTVFFAYMNWWDDIFRMFGRISLHMNMGFYVFLSTILFIAWALIFFFYDHMSYWRITKDQITHEFKVGGGQKSFNTESMAFEKLRDDMFRHWVLGGGSGDLIMYPMQAGGASREELQIHNVLFVGKKLAMIQELIAAKPI